MSSEVAPQLTPGSVLLGRYRLIALLGEGLGGETWRAQPIEGGDEVAIKVVPGMAGTVRHAALVREASFLRDLRHPHVVRYLGIIDLPGLGATFLITELADGGSLDHWVEEVGPSAPRRVAGLLLQILEALDVVHAGGVLHRDLKPANVLVRRVVGGAPHLMLADFGISRHTVDSAAVITTAMGSMGYGAPEVWSESRVTQSADIWSLGAVGWFLLAAQHPQPAPGSFLPDLSGLAALAVDAPSDRKALVALLLEAMAPDPAARPDLAALRRALTELLSGRAASSGRPAPTLEAPPVGVVRSSTTYVEPEPEPTPRRAAPNSTLVAVAPPSGLRTAAKPPRGGAALALLAATGIGGLLLLGLGAAGWMVYASRPAAPIPMGDPIAAAPSGGSADLVGTPGSPPISPPISPPGTPVEPSGVPTFDAAVATRAATPAVAAPAPRPATTAAPAPEAAPAVPPSGSRAFEPAPSTVPAPNVVPDGPVDRLRIGLDLPSGLPADATLAVRGPGGLAREVANTQLLLEAVRAGAYTVEVRAEGRLLGSDAVAVAAASDVRVLCVFPGAEMSAMQCTAR